ncbi:hypothetical protein HHA01_06500 [Halomonas halmophila]|uniref:Uncharacterized protein n=1 Tax=Halomonas halmophila TaxID=252 RepID=A0A4Y4EX39_9GAMM|nr:hypothetical protein HHA01_06500 [Halomonas halmophila]
MGATEKVRSRVLVMRFGYRKREIWSPFYHSGAGLRESVALRGGRVEPDRGIMVEVCRQVRG